jgi:DNA-binding MarR family transcriptional regulator
MTAGPARPYGDQGPGPWQDRHVPAADGPAARSRAELLLAAALEARLQQNSYDRFEDAVAAYFGVNRTAMRCMEVLDRLGQLTAGEIATHTALTSGAVTAMLDRLERMNLVQRLPDQSDRRRVLVQLTDKARRLAGEVYGPLADEMTLFEQYTDDELRLIEDFIRAATLTLDRHAERMEGLAGRPGRERKRAPRPPSAPESGR